MRLRTLILRTLATAAGIGLLLAGLFTLNGLVLASRETPRAGVTSHAEKPLPTHGSRVRILTYNIAKAFLHKGGLAFESPETVRARLARIAAVINAEQPDLVFLQEAVFECSLCPVNQVVTLAEATGMRFWVFGENYNVGLPFLRIVGGNAILSRWPLEPLENPDLPGRKPFWVSTNNRRILWGRLDVAGAPVLVGAVHADSYSLKGGAAHFAYIMRYANERPTILVGDYNAEPKDESLRIVRDSGLFSGQIDGGDPTHLAPRPTRRIDYVLAPRAWRHLETRVLNSDASDHAAVVTDFQIP